jgi:hypothetical protein
MKMSMRYDLHLHPDSRCNAVRAIQADVVRSPSSGLSLSYLLSGRIEDIKLPPLRPPVRQDGLWRSTCFELFLRETGASGYLEFNFSPSGAWAAYRFTGERQGMADIEAIRTLPVTVDAGVSSLTLQLRLGPEALPGLSAGADWKIGLCAVIEAYGQGLSYWALAHPRTQPDFHHADSFSATLAPVTNR